MSDSDYPEPSTDGGSDSASPWLRTLLGLIGSGVDMEAELPVEETLESLVGDDESAANAALPKNLRLAPDRFDDMAPLPSARWSPGMEDDA